MQSYFAAGFLALAFGAAFTPALQAQALPSPQTSEKPAQKAAEKPKKVWTNDDLTDLRSSVRITTAAATPSAEGSAAGEATAAAAAAPGKEKALPDEKDPEYYRKQLGPLRQQRDQLDAKIKEIQDALNNPSQGTNKINTTQQAPNMPPGTEQGGPPRADNSLYGNQIVRPQDQLEVYQKQRDEVQEKIDDLESQARRNGIDPGDIR